MSVKDEKDAELVEAWRKRLEDPKFKTNRIKIKDDLLTILKDKLAPYSQRLVKFNELKDKLLSENHNMGAFWTPSFNGFWDFFTFITFGVFGRGGNGSRLRKALEDNPTVDIVPIDLPVDIDATAERGFSIETAFTEKLDVNYSDKKRDTPQGLEQKNTVSVTPSIITATTLAASSKEIEIKNKLEVIYNAKKSLEPQDYRKLLDDIYKEEPAQAARFFHEKYFTGEYVNPSEEAYSVHNYVEQDKLCEALIENFLDPKDMHQQMQIGINLIFLMALHHSKLNDTFSFKGKNHSLYESILFLNWEQMNGFLTSITLNDKIKEMESKEVPSQPSKLLQALRLLQLLTKKVNVSLAQLNTFFDNYKFDATDNPLLMLFTRKFCKKLFIDYRTNDGEKRWLENHNGYKLIRFLADKIFLPTIPKAYIKIGEELKQIEWENQSDLLNPLNHGSCIPATMQIVEYYVLALSLAPVDKLFDTAREVRSKTANLSAEQKQWLSYRLEKIIPDKKTLDSLKDRLIGTFFHEELVPIQKAWEAELDEIDLLIKNISLNLQRADLALEHHGRTINNVEITNDAVKLALNDFNRCLSCSNLTPENITTLTDILQNKLHEHYITHQLRQDLTQRLESLAPILTKVKDSTSIPVLRENNNPSLFGSSKAGSNLLPIQNSSMLTNFSTPTN